MRQREKIVNFLLCGMKQNLACEGVEIRVRPPYACRSASCYGVDAPGGRKRTRTPRHVQSTRNDGMNEKTFQGICDCYLLSVKMYRETCRLVF